MHCNAVNLSLVHGFEGNEIKTVPADHHSDIGSPLNLPRSSYLPCSSNCVSDTGRLT
jgi:hypothetical protein